MPPFRTVPHTVRLPLCGVVPGSLPTGPVRGTASDRPVHRALIWSALSATPHANGPLSRFSSCAAMSMAAPQVVWDSENRKTFHRATFLRLATVASSLSEDKSAKPQVIGRTMAFFALRVRKGVANRKKVAKIRGFLFFALLRGLFFAIVQRLGIIFAFSTVTFVYAVS